MLFLLYTVKKPKYILASYSSFFIITVIGCYVLIPKLNIFGTAYALGAGFLAALIMLGIPAYKELQKL
jgi:O-antigen/teichoic acid export membrane protein